MECTGYWMDCNGFDILIYESYACCFLNMKIRPAKVVDHGSRPLSDFCCFCSFDKLFNHNYLLTLLRHVAENTIIIECRNKSEQEEANILF